MEKRNSDTIHLLKECDAGAKMAVTSVDEVLEKVCDTELKTLLQESKSHHEKLQKEIEKILFASGNEDKEPALMAKSMSWMKTNVKLGMDNSDATIADLITDGCHMGVKSLNRYLNQYQIADDEAKKLCNDLIVIEEKLGKDLRKFL